MLGARVKKNTAKAVTTKGKSQSIEEFLASQDFVGAITLLEFKLKCRDGDPKDLLYWIAYCSVHLGNFHRAQEAYAELLSVHNADKSVNTLLGICYLEQQMFDEAERLLELSPPSPLKIRAQLLLYHFLGEEKKVNYYQQQLKDKKEDQLCLASLLYLRSRFHEAMDIYRKLLLENRDDAALNMYIAMCCYKLDNCELALETLAPYLQSFPDSLLAINLRACINFKLYNGKAAEGELKSLNDRGVNVQANDVLRHNLVVFSSGERALQVFPSLIDSIPEARLNLVVFYLRHGKDSDALELIRELDPSTPVEHILKGIVHANICQETGNRDSLKIAQQCFHLVGTSSHECDTIPGRQSMASFFFLSKQFEEVNIYLNSIKQYMQGDDNFSYNYGISLAATRNFQAAQETLLLVKNEKYRQEYVYISLLARCYIMNGQPKR